MEKFAQQIDFIIEVDKLKSIFRKSLLTDNSRQENVAEHSWHLAVAVVLLEPYANFRNLDMLKVVKMALIHDIVEIDAGDTYAYDVKANEDKKEREEKAADRIYGLLVNSQQTEMKDLWHEFEERRTPEAIYVDSVDRFLPILHNFLTKGQQWQAFGISSQQVLERNHPIQEGSAFLWNFVTEIIHESVEKGYLSEKKVAG